MKKYLLIAEKPSLMRSIKDCYTAHKDEVVNKVGYIDFIALAGHVCMNSEPKDYSEWKDVPWRDVEYPMVPKKWKIKAIEDDRKKQILKTIKDKIDNYDGIIVGTDSDQEGYGIYYLLEQYLGLQDKPALRFMEHSLTDSEILKSLLTMTDYHTDPTHVNFTKAFLLRSRADWLYGMNMTMEVSAKNGALYNIGRVKAPTIKLVYDNSMAIDNFKPKKYWQAEANYGNFTSTYVNEDEKPKQFDSPERIPDIPLNGKIVKKETKRSTTHAPKLYDLTSIQADAGSQLGLKPTETLEVIQSLYERHKIVSYPRTQCQYVSEAKAQEFPMMLKNMMSFPELAPYIQKLTKADIDRVYKDKKVVNDKEVQKESHDALLPTDKSPVIADLSEREYNVCLMIYKRLLAQFLPQMEEDKTKLFIKHGNHKFMSSGKIVVAQGWKELYNNVKDVAIPNVSEGDILNAKEIRKVEKVTSPPKRLTQATLISAMKNIGNTIEDAELKKSLNDSQGIGTPATRANIIKDIITPRKLKGQVMPPFVEERKNALYITDRGKAYIECLSGIDIASPVFAARMDTKIKKIQRGEASFDDIYCNIMDDLRNVCKQVKEQKRIMPETNYKCPICGKNLQENRFSYDCPDCEFKLRKEVGGITLDSESIQNLCEGKPTKTLNLTAKSGSKFKAKLIVKEGKLAYEFADNRLVCPCCGEKKVVINKGGAFCQNESCNLKIYRKIAGTILTDKNLQQLVSKGSVSGLAFTSKAGKPFTATLVLNKNEKKVEFDFQQKKKD